MQQKVKRTQIAYVGLFYLVSLCSVLFRVYCWTFPVSFGSFALQMYTMSFCNARIIRRHRKTYYLLIVRIVSAIGLLTLIAYIE